VIRKTWVLLDTAAMDDETAYEQRPFAPRDPDPRDLVDDLHLRCNALRRQLKALPDPQCMEEAREYDSILADIEEAESRIMVIEGRNFCPGCHGDGVVTVGGHSVNPFSGVLVNDPQEAKDMTCPDCSGTGVNRGQH
jgi:hypothetical protein